MIPINTQLPIAVGFVDSRQGGRAENQDTCGYADTPLGLLAVSYTHLTLPTKA